MQSKQHRAASCLALGILIVAVAPAFSASIPVGRLLPLAVGDSGNCEFVVPSSSKEKYLLIVGSLSRAPGISHVNITTQAASGPELLPLEKKGVDAGWLANVQKLGDRLTRARQHRPQDEEYQARSSPPHERSFSLFVKDGSLEDPSGYVTVTAGLSGVGRHCQVYVDQACPSGATLNATVDDIICTFDNEIYPESRKTQGRVLDVDRDGRFTILLTPWLSKLVNGKVSLGGFVRGSDFYRDLAAPYGNRCDMMFLNADLRAGPYMHTLLAHEYTHAVIFSEHVFANYLPEAAGQDEEGWLNEGLAHLAEDQHGYSWNNLDYRVSAYLNAPAKYRLIVPDYYGAGLWRSHGNRGATYLFLRWCSDRYGHDFSERLIQSSLSGAANLEAAAQEPIAEIYRQWSAAVVCSGSNFSVDGLSPLQHVNLRQRLGGRLLTGPRVDDLSLDGSRRTFDVAGTAAGYWLLHGGKEKYSRIAIAAEKSTDLQVSLIRLPDKSARLNLRADLDKSSGVVRLTLRSFDADVQLDAAAWEVLVPDKRSDADTSYRPDTDRGQAIREWFGEAHLRAGETRESAPIPLPYPADSSHAFIFKVAGSGPGGTRVSAMAVAGTSQQP